MPTYSWVGKYYEEDIACEKWENHTNFSLMTYYVALNRAERFRFEKSKVVLYIEFLSMYLHAVGEIYTCLLTVFCEKVSNISNAMVGPISNERYKNYTFH